MVRGYILETAAPLRTIALALDSRTQYSVTAIYATHHKLRLMYDVNVIWGDFPVLERVIFLDNAGINRTVRALFGEYNTAEEVETLVESVRHIETSFV